MSGRLIGVQFVCPSMMTVEAWQHVQTACVQAYRAVRGRDYARFDVRLRGDQPYVVDVNPNPDINSESAVTMSAQSAGLTYTDFVVRLAELAAERRKPTVAPWNTASPTSGGNPLASRAGSLIRHRLLR